MEANPSLEGMRLRNDTYEFPLSHFTITITNSERPTLRSARTVPCEGVVLDGFLIFGCFGLFCTDVNERTSERACDIPFYADIFDCFSFCDVRLID